MHGGRLSECKNVNAKEDENWAVQPTMLLCLCWSGVVGWKALCGGARKELCGEMKVVEITVTFGD